MEFKKLLLSLISLVGSAQFIPMHAMAHDHAMIATTGTSAGMVMSEPLRLALENADLAAVQLIVVAADLNLAQLEFVIAYAQTILERLLFVVLEGQPEELQVEIVELGVNYTLGLLTVSQEHRLVSLLNSIANDEPDLAAELTVILIGVAPVTVLRNSLNVLKFLQDSQKAIIARDATVA